MGHRSRFNCHHHFFFACNGSNWEAITHCFCVCNQISLNIEVFLSTTISDPETGLNFIKDHYNPVFITKLPDFFQETWQWHNTGRITQYGFHKDRSDITPFGVNGLFQSFKIIIRKVDDILVDPFGNP